MISVIIDIAVRAVEAVATRIADGRAKRERLTLDPALDRLSIDAVVARARAAREAKRSDGEKPPKDGG